MFCYNCGKELNDDFNLCPYCGADITRYSDETADKAKEYIVEPDVKFELLGRELFFSPRFLEYNTLRKRFFEKAESLEEEYIKFYKSRKHTFVGLFDEEIPEVVQKVTSAVRFGVDVLMEYGIDDIDDTMLANMVVQSGNIKESLGYIYAKAGEIQRYAENLGDYRDIKKQAEVIGKVAGLVSPERSKVQLLQEHSTLVQGHFMVSGIPLRKQATKQR